MLKIFPISTCMPIIMVAYCVLSKVKRDGVWVKILLDDHALDLQYFFFQNDNGCK